MAKSKPVQTTSQNLLEDRIEELKQIFPEAFTEGRVDFEKLQESLGEFVDDSPERYSFSWAGKRDAIRLLQMPTRATLVPCPEESVDWENTSNLFIEGDNLEVLKLLLKPYYGRVKMIYIDPPYNTGNDFIYPDNYADPLETYLQLTGQKDAEGNLMTSNPETSGRYHSAWLSMMYPRLFLARQLLVENGLIFISIDDIELANLRLLMNEIFGEENFITLIVWGKTYGGGAKVKQVVGLHEYILCYARDKEAVGIIELPPDPEARKYYTGKDEKFETRGPFRTQPLATTSMDDRPNLRYPIVWHGEKIWPEKQWQWSAERVKAALENNELIISNQNGKWSIRYKQYLFDEEGKERGAKPFSLLDGPYTQEGTSEIKDLFGDGKIFPFPKPSRLIKQLISYVLYDKDSIILDYFAGSCSTAQATLELNRKDGGDRRFILVQLPEPTDNKHYSTIAEIGKERIRRVIDRMKKEREGQLALDKPEDLGFKVYKLAESNWRSWAGVEQANSKSYVAQMELFTDPLAEVWQPENVLAEVALKEAGFGLNYTVEGIQVVSKQKVQKVTDPEKEQSFYICLDDRLQWENLKLLELKSYDLFICRASALDDAAAANLELQCRLRVI